MSYFKMIGFLNVCAIIHDFGNIISIGFIVKTFFLFVFQFGKVFFILVILMHFNWGIIQEQFCILLMKSHLIYKIRTHLEPWKIKSSNHLYR